MVLSCRLHDLCDPFEVSKSLSEQRVKSLGHWKLKIMNKRLEKEADLIHWHGQVVGMLGYLNRGKTWVLGRLSDYPFPYESMTNIKEDMNFKWIESNARAPKGGEKYVDVRWHLAIDTAWYNAPISVDKPESPSKRIIPTVIIYLS